MKEVTTPRKGIGRIQERLVRTRWSQRETGYRSRPKEESYNVGGQEYDMQSQTKFSMEPAKEDRLFSVR